MTSDRFAPALRDNEPECEGREARRAERAPTEGQLNATSRLYVVDRDEERQAMQMYGAQDAEELAMILDYLERDAASIRPAPKPQADDSFMRDVDRAPRRSSFRDPSGS